MRWLRFVLYLAAGLIVFVAATSVTIIYLLRDESNVSCPDVTGLDVEAARAAAASKGLSLVVEKYEKKKDVAYNRVLSQTPDAAMPVRGGRTVSVILSDGPKTTEIPSFLGMTLEEAQAALQERNIGIRRIIFVPNEAVGKVLAQVPARGQNILDEEGMTLVVGGREKRFFVMPDIAGNDYAATIEEMDKKQIKYSMTAGIPSTGSRGQRRRASFPKPYSVTMRWWKYGWEPEVEMTVSIAPSILSANFLRLDEEIRAVEAAGADIIHIDIMDGHFVPNLTIGPTIVKAIKSITSLPLDVHLMIENGDAFVAAFCDAGGDIITIHAETGYHLHRTIDLIKSLGRKAGLALNPATPLGAAEELLPWIDLLLVMSVNPGFGGQRYITSMTKKIGAARRMIDGSGRHIEILRWTAGSRRRTQLWRQRQARASSSWARRYS